ncbi:kinase-like domain-containing protein [Sordaria brevicollis]|uniref:Kinase-like domain-containing protein n=1 Tax=Sordaria brevicollis TaxID=83679 RepID=A0AAE0PM35_SORBR|nr:kinase-like domain-containing protein [Sordaria brevicollis]
MALAGVFKSLGATNINSNYSISSTLTTTAGPWKVYPAKKKSTGKEYSVFVFDRKILDAHSKDLSRSSAAGFKKVVEEVVERLKKEASSLARLRHPAILELVEPVEETRGGGLQFVTEPVTTSLAAVLQEKDDQERNGVGGRSSRYVREEPDGTRRRREVEIDELEYQKGLLQVSKALEFLHENAGLVHGNLTPDAILINAKSDWKVSGLSFCSPQQDSNKPTSIQPINLSEVLHYEPRLPRTVQMNLDYTSPDFVLDNNLTSSADMFSLGLLCISLYNSPHRSPFECNSSLSSYKRHFQSSQGVPSSTNNYLCSRELPKELANHVLPRLITRRPATRMTAKEFQQSEYFNNIMVKTLRFLDTFPAKTPNEKQAFLRGLIKVLPDFPNSVMEKKILPGLLEEMKDKELISLILHNIFKIIELLPSTAGKRAFGDRVRPVIKEIFVTNAKQSQERDPPRDAGLMIIIEQLPVIVSACPGKEFKDDILPIIFAALESPTPVLVGAALQCLPSVLPVLDFSTIKNELFPVVAMIFSKTNSLAIKVRGLQAFVVLCGGSTDPMANNDGLDGLGPSERKPSSSSSALDKFTMQEKIVPLIKAIKTKEPAVMIAALNVLRIVGKVADADFVAMDILPILWAMSLTPLLDLKQFQSFMDLIKSLSKRVEDEQTRKLQELNGGNTSGPAEDFMSLGGLSGSSALDANGTTAGDFAALVGGGSSNSNTSPLDSGGWDDALTSKPTVTSPGIRSGTGTGRSTPAATFSWSSTPPVTTPAASSTTLKPQTTGSNFRTVTPDLNSSFQALTPQSTQFSQPLQPTITSPTTTSTSSGINWGAATQAQANPWSSSTPASTVISPSIAPPPTGAFSNMNLGQLSSASRTSSSFSLQPPPSASSASTPGFGSGTGGFSLAPPPKAPAQSSTPTTTTTTTWGSGSGSFGNLSSMGVNTMGGMMAAKTNTGGFGGMGGGMSMGSMMQPLQPQSSGWGAAPLQPQQAQQQQGQGQSRSGLDKYESLL